MGLLDQLWGAFRNTQAGQGSDQEGAQGSAQGSGLGGDLPRMLLSALGGGDGQAAQAQGLGNLVQKFQQAGLGDVVQSWVSNQQSNQPVSPDQVHAALGQEHVSQLAQRTGMGQGALLAMLAAALPKLVDALTPNGQVPSAPDTGPLRQATAPPNQAPGDAEAPRGGGDPGIGEAVQQTDATEPTPTRDG